MGSPNIVVNVSSLIPLEVKLVVESLSLMSENLEDEMLSVLVEVKTKSELDEALTEIFDSFATFL